MRAVCSLDRRGQAGNKGHSRGDRFSARSQSSPQRANSPRLTSSHLGRQRNSFARHAAAFTFCMAHGWHWQLARLAASLLKANCPDSCDLYQAREIPQLISASLGLTNCHKSEIAFAISRSTKFQAQFGLLSAIQVIS